MVSALVVIDLANSPSFEDRAVPEFFETSGRNLLAAETAAGVRHHVALSIVAIDRTDNRYFRAALGDPRQVVRDPDARYWGGQVERSLVPLGEARLGRVRLNEWFHRSTVLHGRLRRVRRLCQPVPRPREQAEYQLFRQPIACQQTIAMQVHIAAKQHALWLGKRVRRGQRVEPPGDCRKPVISRGKHRCQSVTSGLASNVLRIAQ